MSSSCNMFTQLAKQPTATLAALPFEEFLDLIRLQDYQEIEEKRKK